MLAEEDSDEEVILEEVDMESASEVGVPEAETESILSAVPESEGSDEEVELR